jgi:hypothetical protein
MLVIELEPWNLSHHPAPITTALMSCTCRHISASRVSACKCQDHTKGKKLLYFIDIHNKAVLHSIGHDQPLTATSAQPEPQGPQCHQLQTKQGSSTVPRLPNGFPLAMLACPLEHRQHLLGSNCPVAARLLRHKSPSGPPRTICGAVVQQRYQPQLASYRLALFFPLVLVQ